MSLSVTAWKKVLDKPKNLGLKVVGTGVSKVLDDCQIAMNEHAKDVIAKEPRDALKAAFMAVDKKCDEVIKKHQKLFTEACAYLQGVKETAKTSLTAFKNEEIRYAFLAQMRKKLNDLLPKVEAAATNKDLLKALDDIDAQLRVGVANASKLTPVYKDFTKGRLTWDTMQQGKPIYFKVRLVVDRAIEFNPAKK